MLNLALVSMLTLGYNEELPAVNLNSSSTVVIVKRVTPLRRRVLVELPVATVAAGVNIIRNTSEKVVNKVDNVRELIREKPIFPRANSIVKNIVTPKRVESTIVIEENPNEVRIEKKVTTSRKNNLTETTEETTTTFSNDMIVEQRRGLLGRTRFRIFR